MVEVYKASKKLKKKGRKFHGKSGERERLSVTQIKKVIGRNGSEGLLSSFATFPKRVCFDIQEHGETVILFLRQHPIVNLGWFALAIFLVFLPALFGFFPPYAVLPAEYRFVVVMMWYLFVFGFVLAKFMSWFFNVFIVTDERLIDADFENLFTRVVSETKIDRVQDVSSRMAGALRLLFNYGHVFFQTAGEVPEFVFQNIPNPDLVAKYINQLMDLEEQEKLEGRVK